MKVLRGWVEMEEKLDRDERGWKSHLRGRAGIEITSCGDGWDGCNFCSRVSLYSRLPSGGLNFTNNETKSMSQMTNE